MSTSIIRINLVIITIGAYQNGTSLILPCGTKFLRVLIFAIFPAHIFPAKNFSTVNILQLNIFQSIIRTISHPRCYFNRLTKNLKVICYTGFTYSVGYKNCSIVCSRKTQKSQTPANISCLTVC